MKKTTAILLAALFISAALLTACGRGGDQPTVLNIIDTPSGGIPAEDETAPPVENFSELLGEMNALEALDGDSTARGVTGGEGLYKVLTQRGDKLIRLHGSDVGTVRIPAGDYSDRTLILEAENAGLETNAALGTVVVKALGSEGITLNGAVNVLAVYGDGVTATLSAGAGTVFVRGKNCTLRLTGGAFERIITVNQTAKVVNETADTVYVITANGAATAVPAGETLAFK